MILNGISLLDNMNISIARADLISIHPALAGCCLNFAISMNNVRIIQITGAYAILMGTDVEVFIIEISDAPSSKR